MKKSLVFIITVVFLSATYLFLWRFYPLNRGMFYGFALLYLLEIYLFWIYHKNFFTGSRLKGIILTTLFWLPMLMIVLLAVSSLVKPYDEWQPALKTYYAGFIFTGYTAKILPMLLVLFSDFIFGVRKLFEKSVRSPEHSTEGKTLKRSEFLKKIGLIGGGLVFGTFTLGMFKWVYDFQIKRKSIRLKGLPQVFQGLKIVQISDLHLGSWVSKNELTEAVKIVNDLNPDLIFHTGDLVNYSTDEAFRFEDILTALKSRYGIFSVLGNHDYGDYKRWKSKKEKAHNLDEMVALHERLGWKLLRNTNHVLEMDGKKLAIIGVENWGSLRRFQKFGDLHKAIQGVESIPVKLLLSHDPTHWQVKVSEFPIPVQVTFSGHTHGAQFGIEVPGMRWSPSQYVYKYWSGLYEETHEKTGQKQFLYVNRGLGSIGYPGRVGMLPEITLIELHA
ncbi:MAG: metallophosphoesterase [Bacteroidales bacterium]